jgi:hypothetical protein
MDEGVDTGSESGDVDHVEAEDFVSTPAERLFMAALQSPYVRAEVDGSDAEGPDRLADLRGWVIALLLREHAARVGPGGLTFKQLLIRDGLDLRNFDLSFPLVFQGCRFERHVLLDYATVRHLSIVDCEGVGSGDDDRFQLVLDEARIRGSVSIDGFGTRNGAVSFNAARIGGELAVSRVAIVSTPENHVPLSFQDAEVRMNLRINNVGIAGDLSAWGATVGRDVTIRDLRADGNLALGGSRVGGDLVVDGAHIGGYVLGTRADVHNDLRVMGARIEQGIDLANATIGGSVSFNGSEINGPTRTREDDGLQVASLEEGEVGDVFLSCVQAIGMRVGGALHFTDVKSRGNIELSDCEIGGQLAIDECSIVGQERELAFSVQGARIGEGLFLAQTSRLVGELNAAGAHIVGQAAFEGEIENPRGIALFMRGAHVEGDLVLRKELRARGHSELSGLTATGTAELCGRLDGSQVDAALVANGIRATEVFVDFSQVKGNVLLDDLDCRKLEDGPRSWRFDGSYSLAGVRIGSFSNENDWTRRSRIAWLTDKRNLHRGPSPFVQLARYYEDQGRPLDARKMMIALNDAVSPRRRRWTYGLLLRYGYETRRVIIPFFVTLAITSVLVAVASRRDAFRATVPAIAAKSAVVRSSRCTRSYPCLVPWIYSMDAMVPVLDLEQEKYWVPVETTRWSRLVAYWLWFSEGLGWAMTSLLVVGLTLAAKRE